jgi:hypothetical protein
MDQTFFHPLSNAFACLHQVKRSSSDGRNQRFELLTMCINAMLLTYGILQAFNPRRLTQRKTAIAGSFHSHSSGSGGYHTRLAETTNYLVLGQIVARVFTGVVCGRCQTVHRTAVRADVKVVGNGHGCLQR